ncbi:hypothetical protein L873DRAFT_330807 [Choiromyces venosus 120613-1]|uniref:Uncharacterized protein n=1 Tax=Choiromyces venosus 120613-1 TaxID=1336337 RepID=A0A3N4JXM1_9PEZI|nr:hypothetical protein L873DRAFT_330807 [Choiromyces venosus 120613-1]
MSFHQHLCPATTQRRKRIAGGKENTVKNFVTNFKTRQSCKKPHYRCSHPGVEIPMIHTSNFKTCSLPLAYLMVPKEPPHYHSSNALGISRKKKQKKRHFIRISTDYDHDSKPSTVKLHPSSQTWLNSPRYAHLRNGEKKMQNSRPHHRPRNVRRLSSPTAPITRSFPLSLSLL